jgi:hypothetical protein
MGQLRSACAALALPFNSFSEASVLILMSFDIFDGGSDYEGKDTRSHHR